MKGEKRGYFPTLEAGERVQPAGQVQQLRPVFQGRFRRNNFNAGVQVQVPLFSARTKANIGLGADKSGRGESDVGNKKSEVSAEVRQKTRRVREKDAAKEVARLELQLAQQDVAVFQSAIRGGQIKSARSGTGAAEGKRTVDGVSGCEFPAAAGATGVVADGGAVG